MKVERLSKLVFIVLFIVGFVGVTVGSENAGSRIDNESTLISLIKEVRMAQEIENFNNTGDVSDISLNQVEKILAKN